MERSPQSLLDSAALQELGRRIKCLRSSTMTITHPDRVLLISCDRPSVGAIKRAKINLRIAAWLLCGAKKLSVYCSDGELIFDQSTWPIDEWNILNNNEIPNTLEDSCMATATKERIVAQASSAMATPSQLTGLIKLSPISGLAQNTGQDAESIAKEIASKGHLVGVLDEGTFVASDDGIAAWTDDWLAQDLAVYKEKRRSQLLALTTTIATPTTKPKTTRPASRRKPAADTANGATATTTPRSRSYSFKKFARANSREGTIGKFLAAQGFDEKGRIEMIEAIAALPKEPGDELTQPEAALQRILKVYGVKAKNARQQFIDTAIKMTGQTPAA